VFKVCEDTVGWVIWPVKFRVIYDLLCDCVWWDVKPYSAISCKDSSLSTSSPCWKVFVEQVSLKQGVRNESEGKWKGLNMWNERAVKSMLVVAQEWQQMKNKYQVLQLKMWKHRTRTLILKEPYRTRTWMQAEMKRTWTELL